MPPFFLSSGTQVTYRRHQGYPGETKKPTLKETCGRMCLHGRYIILVLMQYKCYVNEYCS